jgi:hypothetical protein
MGQSQGWRDQTVYIHVRAVLMQPGNFPGRSLLRSYSCNAKEGVARVAAILLPCWDELVNRRPIVGRTDGCASPPWRQLAEHPAVNRRKYCLLGKHG